MNTLDSSPDRQEMANGGKREASPSDGNTDPVFIVGMNGSGTTMLLDCLDNHPALHGFPLETKILPVYLEQVERYGDLTIDENFRALWEDLRNIVFFRVVNREPPPLPDDWAERERTVGAALDGVFRYFAEREGKRRWCEKSPMYVLHMDLLARILPSARFIHIIRDGRDCAASFHRRWRYTPQRTMYRWKVVVSRGRELGRSLGSRYMELRYEALTADPEANMRRVCEFLDEPFTESVLSIGQNRVMGRERGAQKTPAASIIPNNEKWRTYFSRRELASLERIGGRLLNDLGYETSFPDGDADLGELRLRLYRYRDNARRTANIVRMILATSDSKRRRLMIDKLATNIRHKRSVGVQ